jgi:hypothetical protein
MPKGKQPVADHLLLQAALEGLELQKQRIDEQIAHVRSRLGGSEPRKATAAPAAAAKVAVVRKRRELSPAARRRIAAAQKKRWAEYRKAAKTS